MVDRADAEARALGFLVLREQSASRHADREDQRLLDAATTWEVDSGALRIDSGPEGEGGP